MTKVEGQTMDQERALYAIHDAEVVDCAFTGPADGESALKETKRIKVVNCQFDLRYPLWHVTDGALVGCKFSETSRAACWYDKNFSLDKVEANGIKIIRECDNTTITDSKIVSDEFAWYSRGMKVLNTSIYSIYGFLGSKDLELDNVKLTGKYHFQYTENVRLSNSVLEAKDAFWHAKNCVITDCVIEGEYLAWYSENLKLVRCKITSTQPLCYAKGLVLEDCEMIKCDLSFEFTDEVATVKGSIDSVKNPRNGRIEADSIGELILDEHQPKDGHCEIVCRQKCGVGAAMA